MRFPFGPWRPDLAPILNQQGLSVARNMFPKAGGYRPLRTLANLTNATALDARPRGSISGVDAGGSGFLFAGDATKLYQQTDSALTDRSRSPAYVLGPDHRWDFAKYGITIIAVTPNDEMQFHNLGSQLAFDNVPGNAPRARHVAVVDDFIMAGNIYDAVDGPLPTAISWSAIGQPLNWPIQGTFDAVAVQSDRQELRGGGGPVQDVVGGAAVSAAFQEKAIWRIDHVGGREVFRIKRMEASVGMLVAHSAVAFEREIFFIAEDGFRLFDYTKSRPIGKDKVSTTFLADLDQVYFDRVFTAKDPDETVIWVAYPGAGNTAGRPNRLIFYDYALDSFSDAAIDLEALIQNVTETAPSLDAPATAGDPDDLGDSDPTVGDTSFDDRLSTAGSSRQGAFDTTFIASDFSGALLEGIIETGDIEHFPGNRSFVDEVRPLVDGTEATVGVGAISKRSESASLRIGPQVAQDDDGKCPLRSDGRYHRYRVVMPAGWTDANGMDIGGAQPSGAR